MIDQNLSEVVADGVNGYIADNTAQDVASKVIELLKSPTKRQKFGLESKRLATKFTERRQIRKLEKLYQKITSER